MLQMIADWRGAVMVFSNPLLQVNLCILKLDVQNKSLVEIGVKFIFMVCVCHMVSGENFSVHQLMCFNLKAMHDTVALAQMLQILCVM